MLASKLQVCFFLLHTRCCRRKFLCQNTQRNFGEMQTWLNWNPLGASCTRPFLWSRRRWNSSSRDQRRYMHISWHSQREQICMLGKWSDWMAYALCLKGPLEPSDALVDAFCAIHPASICSMGKVYCQGNRTWKGKQAWAHVLDCWFRETYKIESKKTDVTADTTTGILLQYALQRRGLSMD